MTKFFVASAMPIDYPYKLQKPSTVSQRDRDGASEFIMDSGIGDEVSNETVLDIAHKYDADWVVAKDYLHDKERTTESVRQFMDLWENHETDATPLIPLQPPHAKHYADLNGYDHYVLGGMAIDDVTTAQKIRWIREFREVAPNVYAHGLGVGGGMEFVQKVAGSGLLDSVDAATPEMAGQFGAVLDERLRQKQVRIGNGEGISKRNYALSEFNAWQIQDAWEREANRSGLERYQ